MRNTSLRGDLSEMEIAIALARAGYQLLEPMSASSRYDLAIDRGGGRITRLQCKTGALREGRIVFRVCSTDARRPNGVSYHGQVDAFAVYCPENATSYLVPIDDVKDCRTMSTLRVESPRNRQSVGIRLARDYVIGVRGSTG